MSNQMRSLSTAELIAVVAVIAALACAVWLLVILFKKEQHTRERFAFAALAAFSAMATSVFSAIANERTVFGLIDDVVRKIFGLEIQKDVPHKSDHLLMLVLVVIFAYFVLRVYDNWQGAVSARQYELQRYREPAPLITEGIREAVRIVKRQPPEPIFETPKPVDLRVGILNTYACPAWHLEARDLVLLRSADYEIDALNGWHDSAKCWIGVNRKTQATVAVRCSESHLDEFQLNQFVQYIEEHARMGRPRLPPELIVACRRLKSRDRTIVRGYTLTEEDYDSLLDGLVDFRDYFNAVRDRIERTPLPDAAVTLKDIYVSPQCKLEGAENDVDLRELIVNWLVEPGQRQLALLGECGQGKSTAAWMLAYDMIHSSTAHHRIPLVIELRGKSPANMTPEELAKHI